MKIRQNQKEVHVCQMDTVFMPYTGTDKCLRCVFSLYDNGVCGDVPCTAIEREDKQDGYFRQGYVDKIDYNIKIDD